MYKNNNISKTLVDVHQDLLNAWNDVKDGSLSTESLKGLNGAVSQLVKGAVIHITFAEKYTNEIDKRIYDFLSAGDEKISVKALKGK